MTGETIFSTVVCLICIAPIFITGIVQYRSKKPVGFWAGKKPPESEQVTDVKAYNHKHGLMWILYGGGFVLCFCSGMLFGGEAAAIASMIECFGGLAAMVWYHNRLERRYRR